MRKRGVDEIKDVATMPTIRRPFDSGIHGPHFSLREIIGRLLGMQPAPVPVPVVARPPRPPLR